MTQETTITSRVWKAGGKALVITIPKEQQKIHNIEEEDHIEVTIRKVIKNTQKTKGYMEYE